LSSTCHPYLQQAVAFDHCTEGLAAAMSNAVQAFIAPYTLMAMPGYANAVPRSFPQSDLHKRTSGVLYCLIKHKVEQLVIAFENALHCRPCLEISITTKSN